MACLAGVCAAALIGASVAARAMLARCSASLLGCGVRDVARQRCVPLCAAAFGGGVACVVGLYGVRLLHALYSNEAASAALFADAACCMCWTAAWGALLCAVVCDLKARLIPRKTCVAIAVSGAFAQVASQGVGSLATGALFGVAAVAACRVLCAWAKARGRPNMVGGGDVRCMAALSIASGSAAFAGCFACYLCAAVAALTGCVLGKMDRHATMPMAPFFCLWLWVGAGGALPAPV